MKNIKRITALISILMLALTLNAKDKGNFLWKVTQGASDAYLLGSIHIVPDDIYPLSPVIEDAFTNSDYLVVEADMKNLDQNKVQAMTMQKGLYTDGTNLESKLSPELYKKLSDTLDETGMINITQAKMMKPWLVAITIPQLLIMKSGYKMDNGIDMHFLNAANETKKKILELESAEYQLDLISGFSEELQIEFLKNALDETEDFKEKFDDMVKEWQDDDVGGLTNIINKEMKENPDLKPVYDKLILDRNIKMTEKIDGWLKSDKKETYFIVVGAGHLVDKDGIAEMLKKKGYKVEKL